MHILPWNFLRLLHGLCFLEIVEGISVENTPTGDRIVSANIQKSIEDFKMIQILRQNMPTVPDLSKQNNRIVCLKDLCFRKHRRTRRDLADTNDVAQSKTTSKKDTDEKHNHRLKSIITPYAFGNPSLPGNGPNKGKRRPRKPRG